MEHFAIQETVVDIVDFVSPYSIFFFDFANNMSQISGLYYSFPRLSNFERKQDLPQVGEHESFLQASANVVIKLDPVSNYIKTSYLERTALHICIMKKCSFN